MQGLLSESCSFLFLVQGYLITISRHVVEIIPVQSCGGSQEGSWQVRVSGPSITLKCGFKCLYADANPSAVIKIVAEYLRANASELRKPLARPRILIGLDVETTDWDVSCSFTAMTEHFNAGFPCRADHTQSAGYVCGVGFSVFRPTHNGSSIYKVDQIVSSAIKLPKVYIISKKAVDVHGITDAACYEGQDISVALRPVIGFFAARSGKLLSQFKTRNISSVPRAAKAQSRRAACAIRARCFLASTFFIHGSLYVDVSKMEK